MLSQEHEMNELFTMPFGKHKGKTVAELEPRYLNFLLCQDWFNSKDILNHHIKKFDIALMLTFGKYKGKYIKDINDESYGKFLIDNNLVASAFF